LRAIAELVQVRHETLRKFIEGETETPHRSSREAYARLYRKYRGELKHAAQPAGQAYQAGVLSELKMILAPGEKAAKAEVRAIFAAARKSGETLPRGTTDLERLVIRLIADGYDEGGLYPKGGKRK
jgi:hypothetical protein